MARRKRIEEFHNQDRWLVSYADFITLLFAFFVVMYSISSINEDKYRVLSDAVLIAFQKPKRSLEPIQVGNLVRSPILMEERVNELSKNPPPITVPLLEVHAQGKGKSLEGDQDFSQRILDAAEAEVDNISDNVEKGMESWIDDDIVNIKRNKFWLEVEIKSSLLFESGSSELTPESEGLLVELSDMLTDMPNRIHIEGFTDSEPINTQVFPSNWELSSARAAAVVRLFERNGIDPKRLASIGYAEHQPIADNNSEEARARNRRVVVVVMAALEGREDERIYEFELLKGKSMINAGS